MKIYSDILLKNYITVTEAANRLSKHPTFIRKEIHKGTFFSNSILHQGIYYIPLSDIIIYEQTIAIPNEVFTVQEAADYLSKSTTTIRKFIHGTKFPNAYFHHYHKKFLIPKQDILLYQASEQAYAELISIQECASLLASKETEVLSIIQKNRIPYIKTAKKDEGHIPKEHLEWLKECYYLSVHCICKQEAAESLDIDIQELDTLIKDGTISIVDAVEFTTMKEDIYVYRKQVEEVKNGLQSDKSVRAISHYHTEVKELPLNGNIPTTLQLFHTFAYQKINMINGSDKRFRKYTFQLVHTLRFLITHLQTELPKLDDIEIEKLLESPHLLGTYQSLLVQFINYCQTHTNCTFQNVYKIEYKSKRTTNEIYDYPTFLQFYRYTKQCELHISYALHNQTYAQTWLFVMMHMINGWRKHTILTQLPNPCFKHFTDVPIQSFTDFQTLRFTQTQAQHFINDYHTLCGSIPISKNSSLGQFLCNQDVVIPVATALTICELHRQKKKEQTLFGSLYSYENKSARFPQFFQFQNELPPFKSLKMNRSLLTHFFYCVTDADIHPEIPISLTATLRSHTNPNSIEAYVQATNTDGSLDGVSLNLFNRGHFGWLYNFMIQLSFPQTSNHHNIDERTMLIQIYQEHFTPIQLEDVACFLQRQQQEKQSIVQRVLQMPQEDIQKIIYKILKGEMPGKSTRTQCLVFPNCKHPNFQSCAACQYVIPKSYFLISLVEEVIQLSRSIIQTQFDAIRHRDTLHILKILSLLDQAMEELGEEYTSSFFSNKQLSTWLSKLQPYLQLTKPNI
ncbi:helix-turn-helix domain-containing protein [Bacillus cereus group sp. BfR-BA-01349]|uniref:helix-turn-helix domain-containing protein n=1 Tax=Bacillus cereus group sp. BfR-BA-01349 TaxID=2920312 RepID=UPI001F57C6A0